MNLVVPALSTSLALLFSVLVFVQFLARGKPHQLVWTVALLLFAGGTGSELVAEAGGWSEPAYRTWYLCGAILVVGYLALGTLYLLVPRKLAHLASGALVLASAYAAYAAWSSPVDLALALESGHVSGHGFPPSVRMITPFFNGLGTVVLVGGALYSAWVFQRRRLFPHRVTANVLIACGALIVAAAGGAARLGSPQFLYVGELVGIAVIFTGFLRSQERTGTVAVRGASKPVS